MAQKLETRRKITQKTYILPEKAFQYKKSSFLKEPAIGHACSKTKLNVMAN